MIFILWYKPLFSCFIISSTISPSSSPLPPKINVLSLLNLYANVSPSPSLINAKKNLFENARKKLMKNYSYLWWTDCLFLSSEKNMKTRFQCNLLMSKNTVQRTSRHVTIVTIFRMSLCCDFRPNCCVTKKAQISLHATTFNPVERARRKKTLLKRDSFAKN